MGMGERQPHPGVARMIQLTYLTKGQKRNAARKLYKSDLLSKGIFD
jgi:hypothetical protein